MSIKDALLMWADQFENDHYEFDVYGRTISVDLPRKTVEKVMDIALLLVDRVVAAKGDLTTAEYEEHEKNIHTRATMAILDTNDKLHDPILICGMNEKGIYWNRLFALPYGKEIVIVDEDGDKYSIDEFDELAGETCELTKSDEKVLSDIRASQTKRISDKWRMYVPPEKQDRKKSNGTE